jgi:hypothetical protein
MYSKFVKDDNDVVGLLAYGLFKKHELEFLQNSKETKISEKIDQETITSLISTNDSVKRFRTEADNIFSDIYEKISNQILEDIKKDTYEKVESKLQNLNRGFLYGSFQSLVGSIFFVIFVGIVYFFSNSLSINPIDVYNKDNNITLNKK